MTRSVLVGALVAALAACAPNSGDMTNEPPAATRPGTPIVDVWWVAEDIGGGGIIDSSRVTMMLGGDGKVGGRSGCNNYSARYMLKDGDLTVYPPMIGTKMACAPALMDQEAKFTDILGGAKRASLDANGLLTVTASDGRTLHFSADRSETAMPTPSHMVMRCGGEQFRVRFAPDKANVVLEDGTEIELQRLGGNADPESPRTYTNGRMTFVQSIEGPERGVSFARGRMLPQKCIIAQN